jgi:hypothetical protein
MYLPFDIETVEITAKAEEYFSPEGPYKPSQGKNKQKKGETPEDWEKRLESILEDDRAKARKKAGLYWPVAKVVSIAYKIPHEEIACIYGDDEWEILHKFGCVMLDNSDLQLIGKNNSTFDEPFLRGRYQVHAKGIPEPLKKVSKFGVITDVDHMFSRYRNQTYSLDTYAFGLGVEGKSGVDGSMVHDLYYHEDGPQWDVIVPYNKHDVQVVIEMLNRWCKPFEYTSRLKLDDGLF